MKFIIIISLLIIGNCKASTANWFDDVVKTTKKSATEISEVIIDATKEELVDHSTKDSNTPHEAPVPDQEPIVQGGKHNLISVRPKATSGPYGNSASTFGYDKWHIGAVFDMSNNKEDIAGTRITDQLRYECNRKVSKEHLDAIKVLEVGSLWQPLYKHQNELLQSINAYYIYGIEGVKERQFQVLVINDRIAGISVHRNYLGVSINKLVSSIKERLGKPVVEKVEGKNVYLTYEGSEHNRERNLVNKVLDFNSKLNPRLNNKSPHLLTYVGFSSNKGHANWFIAFDPTGLQAAMDKSIAACVKFSNEYLKDYIKNEEEKENHFEL